MEDMHAAILTRHNAPLTLAEVTPMPLEYGQVLVRVIASGICGAQLQEIRGEKGGPLPHLLGHEGCGVAEEIGPGVTRIKRGDKVVMHWRKAAGIESEPPKYFYAGQTMTSGLVTTFSTHSICSENRLTPVPADTPPEFCAMLGCGLSTALGVLETETHGFGENILVIGCGGLGMAIVTSLHLVAPAHVCACDLYENKRRFAEIHTDEFVNLSTDPLKGKFDLILDTAGAPAAMEQALEHLAPSGRYVMIGQPPPKAPVCINAARHMFEGEGKTIRATQGGGFRPHLDIPRYLRIIKEIFCGNIITHRFPLAEINRAIELVKQGEAGRVLLEMP